MEQALSEQRGEGEQGLTLSHDFQNLKITHENLESGGLNEALSILEEVANSSEKVIEQYAKEHQLHKEEESKEEFYEEQKPQPDKDLVKYIQDMIDMMTTADEDVNKQNIIMLEDEIFERLEAQGIPAEREHIRAFLEELKTQQDSGKTSLEKQQAIERMTGAFYKLSMTAYSAQSQGHNAATALSLGLQGGSVETIASGFMSKSSWIIMAFVYTAQAGLNYRRYRKGQIDKSEFWHRMKINSVTSVSSVAVGSGGAAAGFAIGTFFFPGVGSVIGAVVGGMAGGFVGEKISAKVYKHIEQKIEEAQEMRRNIEMGEMTGGVVNRTLCSISDERFEEAMKLLGVRNPTCITALYHLEDIEAAYEAHLDVLTLERSYTDAGDHEAHMNIVNKYKQFSDAYEDIREYLEFYKFKQAKNYEFD